MQKEMWRRYYSPLNNLIDDDLDEFTEVQRTVKLLYIGIQKAMYEKPVVFTETSRRSTIQSKRSTGKHRSHRKVKIVKTICINRKEFDDYTGPHKHMTCPCWGVIGHWRTYKTGKKVWIEPYRKGKERKTPSAYSPKEYALKEEKKV